MLDLPRAAFVLGGNMVFFELLFLPAAIFWESVPLQPMPSIRLG